RSPAATSSKATGTHPPASSSTSDPGRWVLCSRRSTPTGSRPTGSATAIPTTAWACPAAAANTASTRSSSTATPPPAARPDAPAYYTDPGRSPVANGGDDSNFDHAFDFTDLDHGSRHQIGTLTVESFLVDHPVEAYALRITDAAGRVITYSGDSDECDNLVAAASGADLFLCEAAFQEDRDTARGIHLTGKRAGRVAQNAEASA